MPLRLDSNPSFVEFYFQCKWKTKEEEEYRNKLCHVITFSSENTSSVFGVWPKRCICKVRAALLLPVPIGKSNISKTKWKQNMVLPSSLSVIHI